ncbi:hypothetical protein [Sphingomonas sp.]|uniref:hypothetical protein n=1 Tax=Sphingomonas sp. TaxID=28214 RepID=UPI003BA8D15A
MSAAIAILPTELTVEAAWLRHRALCLRLAESPELENDATFVAELDAAASDWQRAYAAWVGASCR